MSWVDYRSKREANTFKGKSCFSGKDIKLRLRSKEAVIRWCSVKYIDWHNGSETETLGWDPGIQDPKVGHRVEPLKGTLR